MARTITVTTATLKSKAEELRQQNRRFKSKVEELNSTEKSLNSMWDGQANDAFHKAFQKDIMQMNKFYTAIEKYAASLKRIAQEYDKAEKANLSIANTRSYK
ncbi:MAG: WXG100 family type VII secretion target [Lachnospiraceae bacterium]|nr:WXG100 family type VII secretion target [Lachnospiraceae bacterium]